MRWLCVESVGWPLGKHRGEYVCFSFSNPKLLATVYRSCWDLLFYYKYPTATCPSLLCGVLDYVRSSDHTVTSWSSCACSGRSIHLFFNSCIPYIDGVKTKTKGILSDGLFIACAWGQINFHAICRSTRAHCCADRGLPLPVDIIL